MAMQLNVTVNPVFNSSAFASAGATAGAHFSSGLNSAVGKSQPLGRITGQVTEFDKSMAAANARVIAFGASAGSIFVVKSAFERLITSTIQVEKTLADINVVLGMGSSSFKNFSNEIFKAANMAGQTFQTAGEVALEFARHGVTAEETVKRMSAALQLMRISGLSAQESVNAITASLNAFSHQMMTAEDVVNKIAAVDTKFAVSAQDLANAIQRVGSSANDAGLEFNQLLGIVTAAQTITARGGAVIGNAFKSIFTRLARPQVLEDLRSLGIETKNLNGEVLPTITILKNLANQYDKLNSSQRSFIAEAVGGVYQINILKATLADLGNGMSVFDRATETAAGSSDTINERMEALNQTISSKLIVSGNNLTKLFSNIGQSLFSKGAKTGLDSFNQNIESISSLFEDIKPDDSFGLKIGKTLSEGFMKGLGGILTGPGLQVLMSLLTKVIANFGGYAVKATKDFMGLYDTRKKQEALEQSINNFLSQNSNILNAIKAGQLDINKVHLIYLQQLNQEAQLKAQNAAIAQTVATAASPYISATKPKTTIAKGFIPNFNLSPQDVSREVSEARQNNYTINPTDVYERKIYLGDGKGGKGPAIDAIVNKKEDIHDTPVGTFVLNPNQKKMFAGKGFVPNFRIKGLAGQQISVLAGRVFESLLKGDRYLDLTENNTGPDIEKKVQGGVKSPAENKPKFEAKLSINAALRDPNFGEGRPKGHRVIVPSNYAKGEEEILKQKKGAEVVESNISRGTIFEKARKILAREEKDSKVNNSHVLMAASGFVPNFASKIGIVTGDALRGNQYKKALEYLSTTNKPVTSIIGPAGSGKTTRAVNEYGGEIVRSTNFDEYDSFIFDRAGFDLPQKDQVSAENIKKILKKSGSIDVLISSRDTLAKARGKRAGEGDQNIPERSYFKTGSGGAGTFVKGVRQFLSENENAKVFQLKQGEKGFYHSQLNLANGFVPNFNLGSPEVQIISAGRKIGEELKSPSSKIRDEARLKYQYRAAEMFKKQLMQLYPGTQILSHVPTERISGIGLGFSGGKSFPGYDDILEIETNNPQLVKKLNWKEGQTRGKILISSKSGTDKGAEIREQMVKGMEALTASGHVRPEDPLYSIVAGLHGGSGLPATNPLDPRGRAWKASGFVPNFASENAIKTMQEMVERAKNSKDPLIINPAKVAEEKLKNLGFASKQSKNKPFQTSFGKSGIDITLTDIDEQFDIEEAAIREYGKNAFVHIQKNSIEKLKNLIKNNPNLAKNFSALKKEMGDSIRVAETPYAAGFVPNFAWGSRKSSSTVKKYFDKQGNPVYLSDKEATFWKSKGALKSTGYETGSNITQAKGDVFIGGKASGFIPNFNLNQGDFLLKFKNYFQSKYGVDVLYGPKNDPALLSNQTIDKYISEYSSANGGNKDDIRAKLHRFLGINTYEPQARPGSGYPKYKRYSSGYVPNLALTPGGRFAHRGQLKGVYGEGERQYSVTGFVNKMDPTRFTINWLEGVGKGAAFEKFIPQFKEDLKNIGVSNIDYTAEDSDGRQKVRHKLFQRLIKKYAASGFIPNFNVDGVSEALGREMAAGYSSSQVKVGYDSRLTESGGLGVYNNTEGSLGNAINMHLAQGKTLGDIQTQGMNAAKGFVPNFEVGSMEISMLLGVLGPALDGLGKRVERLNYGYDKTIDKNKKLYDAYDKAENKIKEAKVTGDKTKEAEGVREKLAARQELRSAGLSRGVSDREKFNEIYANYQKQMEEKTAKYKGISSAISIGAPMLGGVASTSLKNLGYENAAQAMDTFTQRVTLAGQAAMALPPKLGEKVGAMIIGAGLIEAFLDFKYKVAEANKNLEKQKQMQEQVTSAMSSYLQAQNTLSELLKSGSASLGQLASATRSASIAMSALAEVDPELAREFAAAATPEEKTRIQLEATEKQALETKRKSFDVETAQMKRESWMGDVARKVGIDTDIFAPGSESEKRIQKARRSTGASIIEQETLNALEKGNEGEQDFAKKFRQRRASGTLTVEDTRELTERAKEKSETYKQTKGFSEASAKSLLDQLSYNLKSTAVATDEGQRKEIVKTMEEDAALRRREVELRKLYNQQIENVFNETIQATQFKSQFTQQETAIQRGKEQTGFFLREQGIKLKSLYTPETQIIAQKGNLERDKIQSEMVYRVKEVRQKAGDEVIKSVTESSKMVSGQLKTPKVGAEKTEIPKKAMEFENFVQSKLRSVSPENLAQTLAAQVAENKVKAPGEKLSGFGEKLFGTYESSGAKEAGLEKSDFEDLIRSVNSNRDLLQTANNIAMGERVATAEGQQKMIQQSIEQTAAIKEAKFKDLVNALKDMGSDRRKDRKDLREYSKALRIVDNPDASLARRAEKATTLLKGIPENQRNIKTSEATAKYLDIITLQRREVMSDQLRRAMAGPGGEKSAAYKEKAKEYGLDTTESYKSEKNQRTLYLKAQASIVGDPSLKVGGLSPNENRFLPKVTMPKPGETTGPGGKPISTKQGKEVEDAADAASKAYLGFITNITNIPAKIDTKGIETAFQSLMKEIEDKIQNLKNKLEAGRKGVKGQTEKEPGTETSKLKAAMGILSSVGVLGGGIAVGLLGRKAAVKYGPPIVAGSKKYGTSIIAGAKKYSEPIIAGAKKYSESVIEGSKKLITDTVAKSKGLVSKGVEGGRALVGRSKPSKPILGLQEFAESWEKQSFPKLAKRSTPAQTAATLGAKGAEKIAKTMAQDVSQRSIDITSQAKRTQELARKTAKESVRMRIPTSTDVSKLPTPKPTELVSAVDTLAKAEKVAAEKAAQGSKPIRIPTDLSKLPTPKPTGLASVGDALAKAEKVAAEKASKINTSGKLGGFLKIGGLALTALGLMGGQAKASEIPEQKPEPEKGTAIDEVAEKTSQAVSTAYTGSILASFTETGKKALSSSLGKTAMKGLGGVSMGLDVFQGYKEAEALGESKPMGMIFGGLTGNTKTGSMYSDMGLVEKGGSLDVIGGILNAGLRGSVNPLMAGGGLQGFALGASSEIGKAGVEGTKHIMDIFKANKSTKENEEQYRKMQIEFERRKIEKQQKFEALSRPEKQETTSIKKDETFTQLSNNTASLTKAMETLFTRITDLEGQLKSMSETKEETELKIEDGTQTVKLELDLSSAKQEIFTYINTKVAAMTAENPKPTPVA